MTKLRGTYLLALLSVSFVVMAMGTASPVGAADQPQGAISPTQDIGKPAAPGLPETIKKDSGASRHELAPAGELNKDKERPMKAPDEAGVEKPLSMPELSGLILRDHDYILYP